MYLLSALAVSFLCSILEAVLLSTPVSFIKMKEKEGTAAATLFKRLKTNIDRPISAILSLNTVAHTVGAAGVGAQAVKVFGEAYFGIISAILTVLILVLSEILPKTIGARYWRSLAMASARVIRSLIYITYPLVVLSDFITRLFSSGNEEAAVSREEVAAMVTVGMEEGVIGAKENKVIQNLFRLGNIRVCEIMTPRAAVITASASLSLYGFYLDEKYSFHSRIPLYRHGRQECITGYILRKTVLERLAEDNFDTPLGSIARPALSFADDASVWSVWEAMLKAHEHIAILTDKQEKFTGIVTMEDIIETLLGFEIMDEKDAERDRAPS